MSGPVSRQLLAPALAVAVATRSLLSGDGDDGPIQLGFAGGVTGACGSIVKSELQGVEMALERLNARGGSLGRPVARIKRDARQRARACEDNTDLDFYNAFAQNEAAEGPGSLVRTMAKEFFAAS